MAKLEDRWILSAVMISFPNAKINLGLQVIAKRADGFHDIETVFYPAERCDVLEIIPDEKGQGGFTTTGIEIPGQSGDNLCLRALSLFRSTLVRRGFSAGDTHSYTIHLHKTIPPGAGLGGGSSDAAFTLRMLNEMHGEPFSPEELALMAARLGSDCPFFLHNKPVYATGRGDLFQDIDIDLSAFRIELFFPKVQVSTAEAYRMITPSPARYNLREVVQGPLSGWKDVLVNDFEKPVFEKHPEIRQLRESVYEKGAIYASMTGSGSAVFGIFDK